MQDEIMTEVFELGQTCLCHMRKKHVFFFFFLVVLFIATNIYMYVTACFFFGE